MGIYREVESLMPFDVSSPFSPVRPSWKKLVPVRLYRGLLLGLLCFVIMGTGIVYQYKTIFSDLLVEQEKPGLQTGLVVLDANVDAEELPSSLSVWFNYPSEGRNGRSTYSCGCHVV